MKKQINTPGPSSANLPAKESLDIIGSACRDYFQKSNKDLSIEVWSNIAETDLIPVHYLFRPFNEMPTLEQDALKQCRGKVLDVGAGAGSHALWLQEQGFEVTALEISPGACEVMQKRGIQNILEKDFFNLPEEVRYDTLLMLMNGIGIVGTTDKLKGFFNVARKLLKPGGQILVDSSDLRYLFLEDDGSILINLNDHYYGEVEYRMSYKGRKGRRFPWLFIDDQLMEYHAEKSGFRFERIVEGDHYDYLARLTVAT
ncbi:bifunctional 2-polyprenyl-6-hydroxyphenol methylase/3-demethylubiquinol 3-O-methyltransferase UbiG [Marinilabilia sp.]|uniref:class I SAM-dependent methyltransferase n=1 Tax=Marinilabilia sp. TaxID=2021252 RepID=UPI0025C1DBD0|nr:class I SAM-dependent methyltransferase [Marinilabilia sp.]